MAIKSSGSYLDRLNDMQREAALYTEGPLLILAGAGSGKTSTMTCRIVHLIEQGVSPYNILAVTFTNKAANEMRERVEELMADIPGLMMSPADISGMWIQTFHSACLRILRVNAERLGYERNFAVYDPQDQKTVIKNIVKAQNIDDKKFTPAYFLSIISDCKNKGQSADDYINACGEDFRTKVIYNVYRAYENTLRKNNAMDFDDLLLNAVKLLSENEDVLIRYQNRFKYIMVDEYQDTNHAQYRLVSLLAAGHGNLCVVGDDDQSIYKFRGATIENILSFEEQFEKARVIRLEQNYRSTKRILDAANEVIANNTARKGKSLWTGNGEGEKICLYRAGDERSEAQFITEEIISHVAAGDAYSDHAVLYRMNAQSGEIEKALVKAGIPYKIVGGLRFYDRKEIKDLIAYLSVLNNPNDTVRLTRIINEPKRGIGDATVAAVMELSAQLGVPPLQIMADADQYQKLQRRSTPLRAFADMMQGLIEKALEEPLEILLDAVLDDTGYLSMLQLQGFEGQTRIENIDELRSSIIKFQQEAPQGTLSDFLEEVALYTDLDRTDLQDDSVTLMTMHSAKGLEFPYVFVAGCEEGIFPGRMSMNSPDEIEEERRLAYVAITRAKKKLYLTTAAQRMLFGQTTWNKASRFVREIPGELVDLIDTTVQQKRWSGGTHEQEIPKGTVRAGGLSAVSSGMSSPSAVPLCPGDMVSHKIFGKGLVISASPMANDLLVEVSFDKVGTKKLMANFAKLKKVVE